MQHLFAGVEIPICNVYLRIFPLQLWFLIKLGILQLYSLNPDVPSVTLTWDPPSNVGAGTQSYVTQYHVRFKPRGRNNAKICCSATSIVLDKDSGLIPLTTYRFGVRAQCGDCIGLWKAVSSYFGGNSYWSCLLTS